MSHSIDRSHYAALFGPTTGDRVRLGDTGLSAEVERDHAVYGDESLVAIAGNAVIRGGNDFAREFEKPGNS